ncbi:MAG TPA: hypothetical protein VHC68_02060 [Candidatus Paceibacterota bacterium]|nr:hypothetical protein [Candidatus Paceibacterota bacterium]
MTIAEARTSCKAVLAKLPRDVLVVALILAASLCSFGLGVLAGREGGAGEPPTIEEPAASAVSPVVASKNGSKYYLPWCGGAKAISPDNLITFDSAAAAAAAGYAPAANCKGI